MSIGLVKKSTFDEYFRQCRRGIKMGFYSDSNYKVRKDLDKVHENQFKNLGKPGSWGSGAQRIAIASQVREACYEKGIQERPGHSSDHDDTILPDVAKSLINKLSTSPKDFLEDSYTEAIDGGLTNEEYVEIVGIVSRVTDMDIFARGIGVELRPLPEPKDGLPARDRPLEAKQELAWVPTIPSHPEGGKLAEDLFGTGHKAYIMRALSLVPNENRMHMELENIQYLPVKNILIADYQHHDGLSRAQSEVVAGRISAFNECFF